MAGLAGPDTGGGLRGRQADFRAEGVEEGKG